MRTIILLCLLSLLSGCSVVNYAKDFPPMEQPNKEAKIGFQVLGLETFQYHYTIRVRFSEWTDFEGIAQEIELDTDIYLVEYFKLDNGEFEPNHWDQHSISFSFPKTVRRMRIYPANVEGVDYEDGIFAQLPQNKDGSVKTNIGPYFNAKYQWKSGPGGEAPDPKYGVNHKTTGKVTADDRENSAWWEVIHERGVLTIILPNGDKITIGDVITTKD